MSVVTRGERMKIPTRDDLRILFRKPGDADLDGEAALNRTEELLVALLQAGDVRFAEVMSREDPRIRKAVATRLKARWGSLHAAGVSSPRTRALLAENN